MGSADLSKLEIRLVGGEKSEAEDKKRLPESRKVVELKDAVEEVESCSACYGYLIPALAVLKDEGIFGKLHEKISIGQGYRGKEGLLGVGNCTRKFAHSCPGCCDRIVCLSDLMATMADVLGVDLPDTCAEDSVSNLPLWKDPGSPEVRKDIVHQSIDGSLSIRRGQYKLELCPGSGGWSDPLPGKEDPTAPRFQLYDLSMDISERRNVIEDHLELASELKEVLKGYIENGRSTPGAPQSNNGQRIWNTIGWLDEEDGGEIKIYK